MESRDLNVSRLSNDHLGSVVNIATFSYMNHSITQRVFENNLKGRETRDVTRCVFVSSIWYVFTRSSIHSCASLERISSVHLLR